MNWEAVGAVSDLLAAIAVIVTLVYLAIQIRQSVAALKSTATQSAHDQTAVLYDLLASDPALAGIFARGLNAPDTLNAIETARFYALMLSVVFRLQNWYLQTRSGHIDKELFESWSKVARQISGTPGFKRFWRERRYVLSPDFAEFAEREVFLEEPDPTFHPLGVSSDS